MVKESLASQLFSQPSLRGPPYSYFFLIMAELRISVTPPPPDNGISPHTFLESEAIEESLKRRIGPLAKTARYAFPPQPTDVTVHQLRERQNAALGVTDENVQVVLNPSVVDMMVEDRELPP